MIQGVIASSQRKGSENSDIVELGTSLSAADLSIDSMYWPNPCLASNFPMIPIDKRYFWLISTDHAPTGSNNGAIIWGQSNKLDFSDFEELGTVRTGYQCETPWAMNIPSNDGEDFHLFFHTAGEPGSEAPAYQQTRLITTSGGLLHEAQFTDRDRPLGVVGNEDHTGYFNGVQRGPDIIAVHTAISNKVDGSGDAIIGTIKSSVSSDGRNFTRKEVIDRYSVLPDGRCLVPAFGRYFQFANRWWWIGRTSSTQDISPDSLTNNVVLCKATRDLQITELCKVLKTGISSCSSYAEGDTAWIFYKKDTEVYHPATYDLNNLYSFL